MRFKLMRSLVSAMALLVATVLIAPAALAAGPGLELEVGGPGEGDGKLAVITDITFGPGNHLYVLDGARWDNKTESLLGNLLVQKFTNDGKFVSQFSIARGGRERTALPERIAVDAAGDVYITVPGDDRVERYDAGGRHKQDYPVTAATGIAVWQQDGKERIAVIGGLRRHVNRAWTQVGGDQFTVIDPASNRVETIKLEQAMENVRDLASGLDGHLYVLAGLTIQKIDPQGRIVHRIGSNPTFDTKLVRAGDGSEPLHTVAVDSTGQIYTWSWGNPGELVRFSSDLRTVSLRGGQYKFADYWSPNAVYTPVAVDQNDKVWVAVPNESAKVAPSGRHHSRGWVLRVRPDFLDPSTRVKTYDTRILGLRPRIETKLPYSIAYEPQPIELEVVLPAANRMIDALTVQWVAYDMLKSEIGRGAFDLQLASDEEVRAPFTIEPTQFGWYTLEVALINEGDVLRTLGKHIGVTPRYEGMVELAEGESKGGWEDVPRQMFVGLDNIRLHPGKQSEESIAAVEKYGATSLMQITSNPKDLTPEKVRELFERFKGKVKYWEVINEPNFSISPEKLVEVHEWLYPMLKEIDPEAKVMGPAVCGLILSYHEKFFAAGGAKYLDVVSVHDYEGNESVDLYHWRWKFGQLREMMERYGIGDHEIWQTERVLTGVRGRNTLMATQAIRTAFHRDLLETLGVPPEHNNHYYLNQGGYASVPSYIWSNDGPHPAAMSLRTRYAMTMDQAYQGMLNFGPHGDDMYMGLRYVGDDRQTLIVRNMGMIDREITFTISGATSATIIDAFGNERIEPITDGKLRVMMSQMPTYVRLPVSAQVAPEQFDYGRNIAAAAMFSFSGPYTGDFGNLTNNIMETTHHGHPWGGSGGPYHWRARLTSPQVMELTYDQPREIHALQMFSARADNSWSALRDYDLEYYDGSQWVTIEQVRRQTPESSPAITAGAVANTWHQDDNIYAHQFDPIITDRLRIRFIRATHGFVPDDSTTSNDSVMPQQVHLRELRVFSPRPAIELVAGAEADPRTARSESESVELRLVNRSNLAFSGSVKVLGPEGWSLEPADQPLAAPAGGEQTVVAQLRAPADVPAGYSQVNLGLLDAYGQTTDISTVAIAVTAPLRLEPGAPRATDDGATLAVNVVNTTDQPISGIVRVQLSGEGQIEPIEESFGPIEPKKRSSVQFKVTGVDLLAQRWTARYEAVVNHIVVRSDSQDLATREWLVFGPVPSDESDPFAAGSQVDTTFATTDMMGNELKWLPAASNPEGFVNLGAIAPDRRENVKAWGYVTIYSPDDRDAVLSVGADDRAEVMLNGQPVLVSTNARRGSAQQSVQLKSGWNEILVRSGNEKGNWGFYCDLLGSDGQPMTDLRWSTRRQ